MRCQPGTTCTARCVSVANTADPVSLGPFFGARQQRLKNVSGLTAPQGQLLLMRVLPRREFDPIGCWRSYHTAKSAIMRRISRIENSVKHDFTCWNEILL